MSNVLQITAFRKKKRQLFMRLHGEKLDRSIQNFIRGHLNLDFTSIADAYLNQLAGYNEMAWDYLELREHIRDAISEMIGKELTKELRAARWFDPTLVSEDELIDRCLSAFILNDRAKIS